MVCFFFCASVRARWPWWVGPRYRRGWWRVCVCDYVCNDFIVSFTHCACLWDQCNLDARGVGGWVGWVGWGGGGVWDVPCIPVVAPPHHAPIRDRPHLHGPMLPPSSLPRTLPPCPLLHTCFRNSFRKSLMHANTECNARMPSSSFAPTNCFSTSPSLHSLHPANVGCTHSRAP